MPNQQQAWAPGARILVRDAEWLIRGVNGTSTGGYVIQAIGVSELVRDKEALFLTEIEPSIEILDPVNTKLVLDTTSGYQASLLYMEALLRQIPPTDENLHIGHRAAMDILPYQLDPALQALEQPRHRILIADAVGLGKTLEAGILLSELIRRGRAKRILVVTVKSMLTQFQKEMWSRFTIPLTRLDSIGIQRIRSRIPTNHNPFFYYDTAIISVDTLKQDAEYRAYLEKAYWDVIVIDEAHNVAERGSGASMRARLAKLLATRSDTLIMLSATPHDGKPRSFASLMNMLNPTAIADPDNYTKEDIKGLFIRRFKKDIKDQVQGNFPERSIHVAHCHASASEEEVFDAFSRLEFESDRGKGGGELFKTTLEKALFSSPAACIETIKNRINRLKKNDKEEHEKEINDLDRLSAVLTTVTPEHFSKYQKLLQVIRDPGRGFGWNGKDPKDRLVIFTERIETLRFLRQHLPRALGLNDSHVRAFYGTLSDSEQQDIVEDFGKDESPVRLLIASDVASEGINLHYLCHRMIHFDIPWSLMVFQQRNGRIDRYGQERKPEIMYLVTESNNDKVRGDTRILELLIEKDEQAVKNIGDPATLMRVYDIEEEEKVTARAIEKGLTAEQFDRELTQDQFDPLALLLGTDIPPVGEDAESATKSMLSLFKDDYSYIDTALNYIMKSGLSPGLNVRRYAIEKRIELSINDELKHRFRNLPGEILPAEGVFVLSPHTEIIQDEIKRSREDGVWPRIQYLWELNPMVQWVNDKLLAAFGRQEAPVISLGDALRPGTVVFLLSGLIPNKNGQPLFAKWFCLSFEDGILKDIEEFEKVAVGLGMGSRQYPNCVELLERDGFQALLPKAVEKGREWMVDQWKQFETAIDRKLNLQIAALDRLKDNQYKQLELFFMDTIQVDKGSQGRKERKQREIDAIFKEYYEWIDRTMIGEGKPYIQVIAVMTGGG